MGALHLNARAYEHLAQSLKSAPVPPGLNAAEEKQYREGVEKQFIEPNMVKAREFNEKAVSRAWELEAYGPAYRASFESMHKLDPKTYYNDGEISSDDRITNWMN